MSEASKSTGLTVPSTSAEAVKQAAPVGTSDAKKALNQNRKRNKVALGRGRSLVDWIRYTRTVEDLPGTGGKVLKVTAEDMAKHSTREDGWMILRKKVYNVTPFYEYHPGGLDPLDLALGRDGTELFNEFHPWVNAENMLKRCFVGYFVGSLKDLARVESRLDTMDLMTALPGSDDSGDADENDNDSKQDK